MKTLIIIFSFVLFSGCYNIFDGDKRCVLLTVGKCKKERRDEQVALLFKAPKDLEWLGNKRKIDLQYINCITSKIRFCLND